MYMDTAILRLQAVESLNAITSVLLPGIQNGVLEISRNREVAPGMPPKKNTPPPPAISTSTYRGADRRDPKAKNGPVGRVVFDEKGNAVWHAEDDVPRRRRDDSTINERNRFDLDSLSLQDDAASEASEESSPSETYDPYSSNGE